MEPEDHYRIHEGSPLDSILSYVNPVQSLTSYLHYINFNIIPSLHPGLLNCLVTLDFPIKIVLSFYILILSPSTPLSPQLSFHFRFPY
jgi:hypothetical protein